MTDYKVSPGYKLRRRKAINFCYFDENCPNYQGTEMIVLIEVKNGQRKDLRTNNAFRTSNYRHKVSFCKSFQTKRQLSFMQ